jgi:hypothetical protein
MGAPELAILQAKRAVGRARTRELPDDSACAATLVTQATGAAMARKLPEGRDASHSCRALVFQCLDVGMHRGKRGIAPGKALRSG